MTGYVVGAIYAMRRVERQVGRRFRGTSTHVKIAFGLVNRFGSIRCDYPRQAAPAGLAPSAQRIRQTLHAVGVQVAGSVAIRLDVLEGKHLKGKRISAIQKHSSEFFRQEVTFR